MKSVTPQSTDKEKGGDLNPPKVIISCVFFSHRLHLNKNSCMDGCRLFRWKHKDRQQRGEISCTLDFILCSSCWWYTQRQRATTVTWDGTAPLNCTHPGEVWRSWASDAMTQRSVFVFVCLKQRERGRWVYRRWQKTGHNNLRCNLKQPEGRALRGRAVFHWRGGGKLSLSK